MTTPELAVEVNHVRWYRNPNRHENRPVYRGVTGISSAMPKEGLKYWAANTVATYAIANLDAWRGLPANDAYDLLRKTPWTTRDRAAATGSEVHAVLERMLAGEAYEVEASVEPWIAGLWRFVNECHPKPALLEATCFNESRLYAGTCDFAGILEAFPELGYLLLDWKTGKDLYDDMAVQVCGGYGHAEYYLDDDYREQEWRKPANTGLVHLRPDGSYQIKLIPNHDNHRRAFLACMEIRRYEREGPKLSPPLEVEESFNLVWIRQKVAAMSTAAKLELSHMFLELGIP